jgi:hypothetical protein
MRVAGVDFVGFLRPRKPYVGNPIHGLPPEGGSAIRLIGGEGVNWVAVAPDWAREHGTIIVLLGTREL